MQQSPAILRKLSGPIQSWCG